MDDYFYNKSIQIMKKTEGHKDSNGIWIKGGLEPVKTILCDVQPASREQIYKDYGYYIECSKRVFCDIDTDLTVGGIVKYLNESYTISKIIEWDDYYDMFLKEGI